MNKLQIAEQFRKAVQLFAQTLAPETALEISTIYPPYEIGRTYSVGDYFTYGENSVGDPQLYKVVQSFTSQDGWLPPNIPAMCEPIGLNESGYPVYSKPSGSHDAYNKGDIVDYNGTLYRSVIDGNVYSPEEYPSGWELYEE